MNEEVTGWHHPECEGDCLACLIERTVQDAYGSVGLKYLQQHTTFPPPRPWVGLTDEDKESFWRADQMTGKEWDELFDEVENKLRSKNT